MQLTVHGKHLDVGDSLTEHVRQHLTEAAEKYFPNPIEATVLFTKESNNRITADITIHLGKDIVLKAHSEAGDAYGAFDSANDKLSKRMRRYKGKMKDHQRRIEELPAERETPAVYKTLEALSDDHNDNDQDPGEPAVVAEMVTTIQQMSVSDAVMRLELANANAMVFENIENGEMNVVYRRHDGHIGWIDPSWNKKRAEKSA